ncbi:MAG: BrnA antitoxin family protein [Aestuariivirga sp.]
MKKKAPSAASNDNPVWTKTDASNALSFGDLPNSLQRKLRGRPKAVQTKEHITIRLSPEVVEKFRSSGAGWQTRVDAALKDWLRNNSPV